MRLILAYVSHLRSQARLPPADSLLNMFIERSSRYIQCSLQQFRSERELLAAFDRSRPSGRTAATLILLDRLGVPLSSEDFATQMGRLRDGGAQTVVYAIGPADGWSDEARARANHIVSFGPITLPHELARVVLAEQVYRALTILAGHPYHSGH